MQKQLVKAVASDGVDTIAPYVKIRCDRQFTCPNAHVSTASAIYKTTCIYKCKTKQLIAAVRTFLKSKVQQVIMLPHGIMGNGITL